MINACFFCPGPPVPVGVQVSLTLERIMGLAVYWEAVRGANVYYAVSSLGQNCTSMGVPFCIISPIGCSENHTLMVMAENQAGLSSPSLPQDLLTCMQCTHMYLLCKYTTTHHYKFNKNRFTFMYFCML